MKSNIPWVITEKPISSLCVYYAVKGKHGMEFRKTNTLSSLFCTGCKAVVELSSSWLTTGTWTSNICSSFFKKAYLVIMNQLQGLKVGTQLLFKDSFHSNTIPTKLLIFHSDLFFKWIQYRPNSETYFFSTHSSGPSHLSRAACHTSGILKQLGHQWRPPCHTYSGRRAGVEASRCWLCPCNLSFIELGPHSSRDVPVGLGQRDN